MLTYEDEPTIRNAITKRLGKEPGVALYEVKATDRTTHIHVAVGMILTDRATNGGVVDVTSEFDLPPSFDLIQLHNEIDEIAEGVKEARRKAGLRVLYMPGQHREAVKGTGMRGHWVAA